MRTGLETSKDASPVARETLRKETYAETDTEILPWTSLSPDNFFGMDLQTGY